MTTQPKTNQDENKELTREEALEVLNTPDDQLDELIARAEKLSFTSIREKPVITRKTATDRRLHRLKSKKLMRNR